MVDIKNLIFLAEEVIVEKKKAKADSDAFHSSGSLTDKDSLVLATVLQVGKKQTEFKVGDEILIHEMPGQTIKISGQGILENIFKINPNHIFAITCP